MELTKYIVKSIFRRRKEIFKVCLATVIAMFFVAGMLATQESIYRWQMAKNKSLFGDWFVMTGDRNREAFDTHPYFGEPKSAIFSVYLYDENMKNRLNYYIGSMTQEFIDLGNITLAQGHWPEADNEVIMDYNTLISFGLPFTVGQEIELRYYEYDANHLKDCARIEKCVLSGILNDYTSTWRAGNFLPNIVVTEEKAKRMNPNYFTFLIYPLATYVKTENYHAIYDDIRKTIRSAVYNENVYDFTPWGSQAVYNYLYVLIILIGVVAIAYQMNIYYRYRNSQLEMLRKIGASKGQIRGIKLFEKLLIVGISGILGAVIGILTVRVVCAFAEKDLSVDFFYLGSDVYIRVGISIIIAYILSTVLQVVISVRPPINTQNNYKYSAPLSVKNVRKTIGSRLRKSNGKALNIGVRLFCLVMSVVIVVCSVIIAQSYVTFIDNNESPDIVGYLINTDATINLPVYTTKEYIKHEFDNYDLDTFIYEHTKQDYLNYIERYNEYMQLPNYWEKPFEGNSFQMLHLAYNSHYYKTPRTWILDGIKEHSINTLGKIDGIKEYKLTAFETDRRLSWEGQDYKNFDLIYMNSDEYSTMYKDNYFWGTYYIKANENVYDRLSKYIEPEYVDYNAFERGDQVVVVLKRKPIGIYDDTVVPGKHMNYHNIEQPLVGYNGVTFNSLYGMYGMPWLEVYSQLNSARNSIYKKIEEKYLSEQEYVSKNYDYEFVPLASPLIAGVVEYDDDFAKEFSDICMDYGYYIVIASDKLVQKVVDNQNEFIKDYYGEYLKTDELFTYEPNQISITYDLSSAYLSTHNMVKQTMYALGMQYVSYYDKKLEYRSRCLNAIMQYGITIIAAMAVNICIILILLKNRLDKKRDRMKLLSQLGMTRKELFWLNMKEVLREEVWCVFTMPVTAIISAIMIKKYVKTLNN